MTLMVCRFAAMYKGFLPKVLRLGPGGGILLVVFDAVSNAMRKMYLNPNLNPDQNN
jgi:solute carrier family 25 2-oxodicarboxylate transporter 21